jgi:CRISPR-associated protein Cst1
LLALFLKEVIAMERQRIEAIRSLGDRFAQLVKADNDRSLFRKVYEYKRPAQVRGLLLQMSRDLLKNNEKPFGMQEYMSIFEEGEELTRADFGLAWDLTRMRFMERLYELKWFDSKDNKAVLDEVKTPIDEEAE